MFIAEIKEAYIYPVWNCMDVLLAYSIILSKCYLCCTAFSRHSVGLAVTMHELRVYKWHPFRLHGVHFSHDSGAGFDNVWAFA